MDDLKKQTPAVEEQCQAVHDKNRRPALVRLSQKQKNHQQGERCPKLATIIDAHPDIVHDEDIQRFDRYFEVAAICMAESDVLCKWIEWKILRCGHGFDF